ncbi:MAG: sulfotransferase, partial [Aeromonas sp.]
ADLEDRLLKNNSRLNSDRAIYEYLRLIKILNSNYTNKFWKKSFYKKVFNNKFLQYSEEYIQKLIDMEWQGYWHDIEFRNFTLKNRIKNFLIRLISYKYKEINKRRRQKMYYSYPVENFYKETKKYLEKLFSEVSTSDILALDQLVPCCNTERYLNYFEDIKVIIIDRDPRDLYILNKEIWKEDVIPYENVEDFIKHFRLVRKHQKYERENQKKILRIKFEDTIYDYENTMNKIKKFLEIDNLEHNYPQKYFDPQKSIYNTQLFNRYLKYQNDIKKIENNLKEYCYKFPYNLENENIGREY